MTTQPSAKHSILYVDDELDNLTTFQAVFRRHYHIFTAISPEEARELLRGEPIELIISDQRMPRMTGVEFFESIRDAHPDIVRIILTGYSDVQAIVDAINRGKIYHYIAKPWKMEEMKVILDNALEARDLRLSNRRLAAERNALALQAAQQERSAVQSQFEALRNKVNPHFLFNCMNTLQSLIATDAAKAQEFVAQFCKVYRTVLEQEAEHLVPLRQELDFAEAFVSLQKIRFEGNLFVKISLPDALLDSGQVPPFALQLLLENAIKHNIVADDRPLTIEIFAENSALIVRNNLQLRATPPASSKVGLKNLTERYALLHPAAPPVFGAVGAFFVAKIPVLEF